MPAFRTVVSMLVRFVGRTFSTNSRPACGRPPPAAVLGRNDTTVTGEPASPSTPAHFCPLQ